MERKPLSTGSIVGAVVLLVVVLLALYVGGYFALGKYEAAYGIVTRKYSYDWQVTLYRPMVRLEGAVIRRQVYLQGPITIYNSNGRDFYDVLEEVADE